MTDSFRCFALSIFKHLVSIMNLSERLYHLFSIRWVQHISFWLVFLLLLATRYFHMEEEKIAQELLIDLVQFSIIACLVYFNLLVLLPRLWNKGEYKKYLLAIFSSELVIISILITIFYVVPNHEFKPRMLKSPLMVLIISFFKTNIFIFSTSLFHFAKEWMKLKDENLKYTEKAQEQLEAEISILKAQVNPHFLFNTLNNIYSMSLYDSNKTPEMILKLSQLISYMLYECKDEEVSLEKEIQFIKNYIDLESVRVEDIAKINLNINGEDPGHKVPPLLFIPLIENAFKHGISTEQSSSEININLAISENKIDLEINNPIDSLEEEKDKEIGGLGIENVKKRLKLLFPDHHIFDISQNKMLYTTKLSLILS